MVLRFLLYNIYRIMQSKNGNWDQQHDHLLLMLIKQFKHSININWAKLILKFNQICTQKQRTLKECKQRYADTFDLNNEWLPQELSALISMYLKNGSSWFLIAQSIKTKSSSQIKNRFYYYLKRGVNNLNLFIKDSRKKMSLKFKWGLHFDVLSVLFDTLNQIQKWACEMHLTLNQKSRMFYLRKEMVEYCISQQQFTQERIKNLINQVKKVCFDLKSYKFFKTKGKPKLDKDLILKIYSYDKFVNQELKMNEILNVKQDIVFEEGVKKQEQPNISDDEQVRDNQKKVLSLKIDQKHQEQIILDQHIPLKLNYFYLSFDDLGL